MLDKKRMLQEARTYMQALKFDIQSMKQPVSTLSGGQRQGVAVARAAAFGRGVIIMDEPTAALGVRESGQVIDLIRSIRERLLPLGDDVAFIPGHGPMSTLGKERRTNPFVTDRSSGWRSRL